jgi:hypothetical protein
MSVLGNWFMGRSRVADDRSLLAEWTAQSVSVGLFNETPQHAPARLVVSIDGTSSRLAYWPRAVELHDCLLEFLPQQFAIALAVYRNGLDTFTPFFTDRGRLRARAARIRCYGMAECVPEVLAHASKLPDLTAVINVTDLTAVCEPRKAFKFTEELCRRGTAISFLVDPVPDGATIDDETKETFERIAGTTGGEFLFFEASALPHLFDHLNLMTRSTYS